MAVSLGKGSDTSKERSPSSGFLNVYDALKTTP